MRSQRWGGGRLSAQLLSPGSGPAVAPQEDGVDGTKAGRTSEHTGLVVRIQQASHVPLKGHYFPSACKAPVGGPCHQDLLYAPGPHCPGADVVGPGAWPGVQKCTRKRAGRGRAGKGGQTLLLGQVSHFRRGAHFVLCPGLFGDILFTSCNLHYQLYILKIEIV